MKPIIILLLFASSCSFVSIKRHTKKQLVAPNEITRITDQDYLVHLNSFGEFYLKYEKTKLLPLSEKYRDYLRSVADKIASNNELIFDQDLRFHFFIIKDERPFYFSLPEGSIFMSTGLLTKYVKNENILACIVSYEMIKLRKGVYYRNEIIPTGSMSTERIISLLRVSTSLKNQIHKWAYYIMDRSGYNNDYYLSWIQIQNRNALDFSLHVGDVSSISREEYAFKSFLIGRETGESIYESRKDFYTFLEYIRRRV